MTETFTMQVELTAEQIGNVSACNPAYFRGIPFHPSTTDALLAFMRACQQTDVTAT